MAPRKRFRIDVIEIAKGEGNRGRRIKSDLGATG